jgi:phosphohistidine swiveling domain-containing protein
MKTLQEYKIQNDKLLIANEALDYQLQEEYKKTIALINEKSGITIDRLIAQKNLSVAEAKIAALEVELLKTNKSVEAKEEMNQTKTDVSGQV